MPKQLAHTETLTTAFLHAQATDAASFKFVVKVPMGASPGEVIGVIKVNGKPYGSVTVPPGSKPGKRLKMQVPHPPGSKVSFDYAAAYVPPGEGSRVSPAAPVRCTPADRLSVAAKTAVRLALWVPPRKNFTSARRASDTTRPHTPSSPRRNTEEPRARAVSLSPHNPSLSP